MEKARCIQFIRTELQKNRSPNRSVAGKEMKTIMKNLPTKKNQGTHGFLSGFCLYL
jgi:hypothetical protein